jgi:hypothetical protein
MLVEFFNSLDPYRFFAEAPLFLIFFLPGLIVGAILYVMYRGLLTLTGEDEEVPFLYPPLSPPPASSLGICSSTTFR